MTDVDWRVDRIPAGHAYATSDGEVIHYVEYAYPVNSFGTKQGRAACGRVLWDIESRCDLRVCEDCWTAMLADDRIDTSPPEDDDEG